MVKQKKTLGKILATFQKTQIDLEDLINQNNDLVDKKAAQMQALELEIDTTKTETAQAETVLANIKKLLGTK